MFQSQVKSVSQKLLDLELVVCMTVKDTVYRIFVFCFCVPNPIGYSSMTEFSEETAQIS